MPKFILDPSSHPLGRNPGEPQLISLHYLFQRSFNFCHIFSISYFLKYIRVPTYFFSKELYAEICVPYYYILVNNWLKSILKSHSYCHRKFVLQDACKESFLFNSKLFRKMNKTREKIVLNSQFFPKTEQNTRRYSS